MEHEEDVPDGKFRLEWKNVGSDRCRPTRRAPFDNPECRRLHVAVHIHMQMNIKYAYVRSYIRTTDCMKPTVPVFLASRVFSPLIKKTKVSRRMWDARRNFSACCALLFCIVFAWYFRPSNLSRGVTFLKREAILARIARTWSIRQYLRRKIHVCCI